ncbi:hypothetical protein ANRL3_00501 [Anaerolineae bacterium]|nr:hypothetical protein ANRL3_00501 [Anaerolineae bacterium]
MKRLRLMVIGLSFAALATGCAPTVVVENKTTIPVRAIVVASGQSNTVSPSPGESSSVEAPEGSYRVTVIPDAEWIEYAKLTRKYLNDQLANSDRLTGAQLLEVIRRLKDVAARMQQFEGAAGSGASCSGRISEDKSAVAVISVAANGKLTVVCR